MPVQPWKCQAFSQFHVSAYGIHIVCSMFLHLTLSHLSQTVLTDHHILSRQPFQSRLKTSTLCFYDHILLSVIAFIILYCNYLFLFPTFSSGMLTYWWQNWVYHFLSVYIYPWWWWWWLSYWVVSDSYNPMDCSLPDSSVHRTSQARIMGQVAISFSRTHTHTNTFIWYLYIFFWPCNSRLVVYHNV